MAPGGDIQRKHPGTFGHANAWSMHPLKPLNVMGDGGMVSTNDDDLAGWMRMYRNHGMIDRDHNSIWGVNMRLQPLQAIVGSHVLKTVRQTVDIRNRNARMLDEGLNKLKHYVTVPPRPAVYRETFSLYMARFKKRDALMKYLIDKEVEAKVHYPVPLHLQKAAEYLNYKPGDFPVAETYSKEIMTLPVHQYITKDQIDYTSKMVEAFYKHA